MKFQEKVKLENKLKYFKKKIGILGGTFDPAHKGHIKISMEAKKRFNLDKVIWAITKKNPFKIKSYMNLTERIKFSKKINKKNNFIKINFFEKKLNSNRTVDLIIYLKKKNLNTDFYFIMGADNLINFHKWHRWKKIASICQIIVFDRKNYKAKAIKSIGYKRFNKKSLEFVSSKKVNISSSQLRKI